MSNIKKNTQTFLRKRFPKAMILNLDFDYKDRQGNHAFTVTMFNALDQDIGIKQRAIAIENLGSQQELNSIIQSIIPYFTKLEESMLIEMDDGRGKLHNMDSTQMTIASRLIIYTNKLYLPPEIILQSCQELNLQVDIIDESKMYKTVFISYGGSDEKFASQIDSKLRDEGVQTWFFPNDSLPGQKLHRMMHNEVNNHDKVLLVCSKNSLNRNGVLNEIERVLEREAKEGGSEILIPITIDDFVLSDWAPERQDLSEQIRSRIITKISTDDKDLDNKLNKILKVLENK